MRPPRAWGLEANAGGRGGTVEAESGGTYFWRTSRMPSFMKARSGSCGGVVTGQPDRYERRLSDPGPRLGPWFGPWLGARASLALVQSF